MNDCLFWICWGHKFENISRSWAWNFWTIGCSCSLWSVVAHNSDDYSLKKKNSRSRFLQFWRSSCFQRFVQLLLVAMGKPETSRPGCRDHVAKNQCHLTVGYLPSNCLPLGKRSSPLPEDRIGPDRTNGMEEQFVPVLRRWNSILGVQW